MCSAFVHLDMLACKAVTVAHLRQFVELMLLGFVSLLLVVFQELIQKICIDESLMEHWLPLLDNRL